MVAGIRKAQSMFTKRSAREPDIQSRLNNLSIRKDLCSTCSFVDDEEFTPAHYDLNDDEDWLKSKHRILLYPSSNEEKFLKRKMVHPVPKATGPRDDKCDDDDYHVHNFDWKGKRGSFGLFETNDLAQRHNVHPLRLLYPKTPKNPRRNTMRNSLAFKRFHSTEHSPHSRNITCKSKSDTRFDVKRNNDYEPAKYDINDQDDNDWLKSKHRTLLYPSSSEEAFLKRKMSNPVPKAFGPRDVEEEELPSKDIKYNWKGKRGSVGDYETIDLDKNNIYPVRLMYPKTPNESKVELSNINDVSDSWVDGTSSGKLKRLNSIDLNFECDQTSANGKCESYESSETGVTKRRYKWKGMHGSLGDYEAVNNTCNGIGSIYPLRLMYSKSEQALDLTSVDEDKKTSSTIPKLEKRSYDWKGKRGSIGDFETITPASSMSSIFPLRMLYPKSQPSSAHSSPSKSREKKKTNVSNKNRETSKVKEPELEERSYDWKGKRGSIGLFETVSASGNIFPLRMMYPKTPRLANHTRSCPILKKSNEGKKQKMRNSSKGLDNKPKYTYDSCASGSITPLDTYERHELSDDSTHGSRSVLSVIKLGSEGEVGSNSMVVPPNLETPKVEKRTYYWKGKRGSIGEFETIDSSQPTPVSSIYPLRLLYPKSRAPASEWAQSTPANLSTKSLPARLRKSPSKSPGRWTIALHEVSGHPRQNAKWKKAEIENDDIKKNKSSEEKLPQLAAYSSCATSGTRWSEDDLTSVGKSVSICSSESVTTYKRNDNIRPGSKTGTSAWRKVEETISLPTRPRANSKKKMKEKEVSVRPKDDLAASLPKIPEVKSLKDNKPTQRRKTFSGGWTPAKYDIPDPIADIKKRGIYAPLGLYSSRGSRHRSKSAIRAK